MNEFYFISGFLSGMFATGVFALLVIRYHIKKIIKIIKRLTL